MLKPIRSNYNVDSQMHAAMDEWAKSHNKPSLRVTVTFADGSIFEDEFVRVQKDVSYKVPTGETYEVTIDTAKYNADWLIKDYKADHTVTKSQLQRMFIDWLDNQDVKDVTFYS